MCSAPPSSNHPRFGYWEQQNRRLAYSPPADSPTESLPTWTVQVFAPSRTAFPASTGGYPASSARASRRRHAPRAGPGLQHRGQLPLEHKLASILRRGHPQLLVANGGGRRPAPLRQPRGWPWPWRSCALSSPKGTSLPSMLPPSTPRRVSRDCPAARWPWRSGCRPRRAGTSRRKASSPAGDRSRPARTYK